MRETVKNGTGTCTWYHITVNQSGTKFLNGVGFLVCVV